MTDVNARHNNKRSKTSGGPADNVGGYGEDRAECLTRLTELCRLDLESVCALDNAITELSTCHPDLASGLQKIRDGHAASASVLATTISSLGGTAPELDGPFEGYLIGGMFSLRQEAGAEGILRSICTNETLLGATYEASLYWPASDELRATLEGLCRNERGRREAIAGLLARAKQGH